MNIKSLYEHNSKTGLKVFILIFLICIIVRILLAGIIFLKNNGDMSSLMHPDAQRHYETAVNWSKSQPYFYKPHFPGEYPLWDVPLYPAFLSIFFRSFGHSIPLAIFLNILLFTFSACMLYKIGLILFNGKAAFIAAVIFALYPPALIYSLSVVTEPLFLFLFLSGIYFFILFLVQKNILNLIFAAILMALSALTKEIVIFFPAILATAIFMYYKKDFKKAIKFNSVLTIIYVLIISFYIMYSYHTLGQHALSYKTILYTKFLNKEITAAEEKRGEKEAAIVNYFRERKHFFFGTGTIILMKALKYDTAEIEGGLKKSVRAITPIKFFLLLKNIGWGWVIFQFFAWLFIACVYIFSLCALFLLFMRKRFKETALFLLTFAYFLTGYYYHHTTRYFIPIVPFLSILSAYAMSAILNFRKAGTEYAKR